MTNNKRVLVVIPARYGSTRFPGKPLQPILGKPMIQWVYEAAIKSEADDVYVATDDLRILDVVSEFGNVILTREHETGTDRIIEAVNALDNTYDYVINLQGDEPLVTAGEINQLIKKRKKETCSVVTVVSPMTDIERKDRNTVKAYVIGDRVLMFTRSPLYKLAAHWFKHQGIYAFTKHALKLIEDLKEQTENEKGENLEQLRWADTGFEFGYCISTTAHVGVDTPPDIKLVESILKQRLSYSI